MNRGQLKRLKGLEKENARLRRAVSDLTLDKLILSEAAKEPKDRDSETSEPFTPAQVHRPGAAEPRRLGAPGLPHAGSAPFHPAQGSPGQAR